MKINWESKLYMLYFISSQAKSTNINSHIPLMLNTCLLKSWILQVSWVPCTNVASSPCTKSVQTSGLHISTAECLKVITCQKLTFHCSPSEIQPKTTKSLMSCLGFMSYWVSARWLGSMVSSHVFATCPCLPSFARIFSCLTSFLRLGAPLPLPFFCFFPPEASG